MYTPFKSDLMNNMDHKHISGTESLSTILGKAQNKKKCDAPKVPKQAEAERDGAIDPKNCKFNKFHHENFWCC